MSLCCSESRFLKQDSINNRRTRSLKGDRRRRAGERVREGEELRDTLSVLDEGSAIVAHLVAHGNLSVHNLAHQGTDLLKREDTMKMMRQSSQ